MTGKTLLLMGLALSTSLSAFAASGKTADGCSYQIINGKYLTTCGKPAAAAPAPVQVASVQSEPSLPTSYGTVPMRYEPNAPRPSIQQSAIEPQTMNVRMAPPQNKLYRDEDEITDNNWERKRARNHQELLDSTYVGAILGANTMTSVSAGSALGLGVNVGTNIDDHYGFELGYSYSSQDLNLNLADRSNDPIEPPSLGGTYGNPAANRNDATLRSHLISGEFQGHFTDSYKRLRPYLGLGLGWKASSVEENGVSSAASAYGSPTSSGSLSQSTLGGIGSAGVKFRITKAFNFGASFRYFMPLLRQDSTLEQGNSNYNGYGIYPESRLTKADDALTGSGQYQILGGIQYLF